MRIAPDDRPHTRSMRCGSSATKTDLQAVVDFKDFGGTPAWKYLGPNVEGGPRRKKSHEPALQRAGLLDADECRLDTASCSRSMSGRAPRLSSA
jgi:hypothetical protein